MRILAVIPARAGSQRIPGKNLADLGGKPLVQWTFDAAHQSATVSCCVVATDDSQIGLLAESQGFDVTGQPAHCLAGLGHASETITPQVLRDYAPDIVLLLLPTCPFRTAWHIDQSVKLYQRSPGDAVIGVRELPCRPTNLRTIHGRFLRPVSGEPLHASSQDSSPLYAVNGAIFLARAECFARARTFHLPRAAPYVMDARSSLDIDTPDDLTYARALVAGETARLYVQHDDTPLVKAGRG